MNDALRSEDLKREADELTGEVAAMGRAIVAQTRAMRQKTQAIWVLVAALTIMIPLLVGLGVQFNNAADDARNAARHAEEAAEANGLTLVRIEEEFVQLTCYASVLARQPPPKGVTCPDGSG